MKRPNKFIQYLLSGLCIATSLVGLASCNGGSGSGIHSAPFLAKLLGHKVTSFEGKEATCYEEGWEAYEKCEKCDYSTYEEIPALGHAIKRFENQNPTCTEVGWEAYEECTRKGCGYSTYQEIPARGHTLATVPAMESTCLHHGWNEYKYCLELGCGYSEDKEFLPLIEGHEDYITEYEGVAPTCTEEGYADYVSCSECNDSTYRALAAKGHNYALDATTATCTESGKNYYTCTDCKHTKDEPAPALGHNLFEVEEKAPTCTEIGWEDYAYCTREDCEYTTYRERAMLPHDCEQYEGKTPDCTTDGYKAYEMCKDCAYTTYEKIPALGHSYVDGICTVCEGYESALLYHLKEDGTYEIVGIEGKCQRRIVIPNTYRGVAVTSIASLAPVNESGELNYEGLSALKQITIPVSIVEIGTSVFYYCNNLTTVYYGGGVLDWLNVTIVDELANPLYYAYNLYLKNEESGEFEQPTVLEIPTLELPNTVFAIRDGAFRNCYSLTELVLPKTVLEIGIAAFYNCVNLQKATISGSVGASAFRNCYKMTEVNFEANVTSVGDYAFMGLGSGVFNECEECKNTTATVAPKTECTCAYEKIEIALPDSVKRVGVNAFYNCHGLQTLSLGDGLESVGTNAFRNAKNLKSVVAGTSLKTVGANAFADCDALEKVEISDANAWASVEFVDNLSNPLFYAKSLYMGGKPLESVTLSGIKEIKARAFVNCDTLVNVTIGNTVTVIGEIAFASCSALESVTFEKDSALTAIGNSAFAYCKKLTSIVIPEKVVSIGAFAFQECEALESVTFENTEGWKVYEYLDDEVVTGTLLSSQSLGKAQTAVNYLTNVYCDKYWQIVK